MNQDTAPISGRVPALSRALFQVLILAGALSLLPVTGQAAFKKLDPVPKGLPDPPRQTLEEKRGSLFTRLTDIKKQGNSFNTQCKGVEEGSPQEQKCRSKLNELLGMKAAYNRDAERFNAAVAAAKKRAARREARVKLARMERASALRVHRQHVKGLQETLRRLDRTMLTLKAEREQWERATDQAMENAWKRGRSMLIDETIGALGKRLTRQLDDANEEIRRAVDMLASETDPARRERLHAAIKLIGKHRGEIRRAKDVMLKRVAEAHKIYDAADWATGQSDDLEKSLRTVHNMVKMTLDDPAVQKALKMSGVPGAVAKYGESIADSAYDITTEIISWKRINQINLTTDAYLAAVGHLSEKMEGVVRKIEAIKSQ